MKQLFDAFDQIETTGSRTAKLEILKGLRNDFEDRLKQIFKAVHDPFTHFWTSPPSECLVGKFMLDGEDQMESSHDRFNRFVGVLYFLSNRIATGDSAKQTVHSFFASLHTEQEHKWYSRILSRDLKMGISYETVNKLWPGLIPIFDVMLCGAPSPDELKEIFASSSRLVEPKIDGVRAVFIKEPNSMAWTVLSRNGKPLWNVDHIINELNSRIPLNYGIVLDGEIYDGVSFRTTMSKVKTQYATGDVSLRLIAFDAIPYGEWTEENAPYAELVDRRKVLEGFCRGMATIQIIEQVAIHSNEQFQDYFEKCMSLKYEGVIVKDASSLYKKGDRSNWFKVKPVFTEEFVVIGSCEGNGRNAGRLGGLIVRNHKDLHQKYPIEIRALATTIEATIGGGYSDQQRDEFWKNRDEMVGKLITVEYKEITALDPVSQKHSIREPVFIAVRDYE